MLLPLLLTTAALAGDGPWTLQGGEHSLYVGGDYYRYGDYTDGSGAPTTLDTGLTASGLTASVGRTDVAGNGWYRASADASYWYRFPNAELNGQRVPGDEVAWSMEAVWAPRERFSIGPAVYAFHRLWGRDFRPGDLGQINVFSALKASQLQAGGKLGIYAINDGPTVSIAVLRAVYARNNPTDTLVITAGIGWWLQGRDRGDDAPALPPLPPPPALPPQG